MDRKDFDEHTIWRTVDDLSTAVAEVDGDAPAQLEPVLRRLRYLVSAVEAHKSPTDPAPYSSVTIDATDKVLQQLVAEVRGFVQDNNDVHFGNIDAHSNLALHSLGSWPSYSLKGGAAATASKTFNRYSDLAEDAIHSLRQRNDELAEQLRERAAADAQREAAANEKLTELQAKVAELTNKITQDEARLDSALTNTNETFTASQTKREDSFNKWIEEQAENLKSLAAADLSAIADSKSTADTKLSEIESLRDDTQVVAGLAAGDQVARGYRRYSQREWFAGGFAYLIGFIALALGGVAVVRAIDRIAPDDAISWQFAALKLGLTVTAIAAAIVAFRLGGYFLSQASIAKRFELELKALGPLFPHDDDRETLSSVKKDLIERSFGQRWTSGKKDSETIEEQRLLEKVGEVVARVMTRPPA